MTVAPTALTVLTTVDSAEKAEALARGAVEARLAACAQIVGPITSVYHWQRTIEASQEWQVVFKTTQSRYDALEAHLLAVHDYETPEIVATAIVRASAAYLKWIETETGTGTETGTAVS
ncbi:MULTISPECIES: divalent-cation tolerance protein CutA [Streptomyces]|uniref:divalent-cation tolerance protein CutA n=1 Tax=Streptomyces TaxID=1883 RepID=UPI001319A809|nr:MULTISPECIES: divalent-cation tolerance protein CutA [Streptomyces]QGZ48818.1 divalent cation tolerance protein CutA [Streptomyces sp. QHH-9511]GGU16664.1 divalent cation tolerance protein [Streptomyces lateritius]